MSYNIYAGNVYRPYKTEAKVYMDFNTFKIRWKKLLEDIINASKDYHIVTHIFMDDGNDYLTKKLTLQFNVDGDISENEIYVSLDVNGEDVQFLYCLYPTFEHCGKCTTMEELTDVVINATLYKNA